MSAATVVEHATGEAAALAGLARQRLAAVLDHVDAGTDSTLDVVMLRLFDTDHRGPITYSAFGSAL